MNWTPKPPLGVTSAVMVWSQSSQGCAGSWGAGGAVVCSGLTAEGPASMVSSVLAAFSPLQAVSQRLPSAGCQWPFSVAS